MASPLAPATEPAAAPQAEPAAASAIPEDFDFDTAFSPSALIARPTVAASAPEAPVGEPVAAEAAPADAPASTPDGEAESEPAKLSRRQQLEAERQAELAAARQDWEAERTRADTAEREAAALREANQQRVQGYLARVGDDAEFNRLNSRPSSELSYDDQVKLDNWKLNRVDLDLFQQDALYRVQSQQAASAQRVSGKPGVSVEVIQKNPDFGAICEHFYDAGAQTVRAELNDRIAQLEADNKALLTQRVGQARQPEAGGNSPPASSNANPNAWNPDLPVDDALDAAFGARVFRRAS